MKPNPGWGGWQREPIRSGQANGRRQRIPATLNRELQNSLDTETQSDRDQTATH